MGAIVTRSKQASVRFAIQMSMSNVAAAAADELDGELEPMAAIGQRVVVCAYTQDRSDRERINVL